MYQDTQSRNDFWKKKNQSTEVPKLWNDSDGIEDQSMYQDPESRNDFDD